MKDVPLYPVSRVYWTQGALYLYAKDQFL